MMNSGTNDISVLVELFILTPRERNNLKVVFFLLLHTLEKIKQILLEENLRLLPLFVFPEFQLASTEAQWGKLPHLHKLVTARW